MLAGLLYLIGLITILVNLGFAAVRVAPAVNQLTTAMDAGTTNMVDEATRVAATFAGYVWPLLVGLLLMGLGRIIMLLGAINRSLRGQV